MKHFCHKSKHKTDQETNTHSAATAAMRATTAPPMLILMLSAPLEALAVALAEVLEAGAEPAAVVAAADSRVVGREMDGDAERMEELLYGEPVDKTSAGADVVYDDAVPLPAAVEETAAELDAVLETTTLLLALLLPAPL